MKRGFIMLAALCMLTASTVDAQKKKSPSVLDVKESITDNSIVFPESFETETQKLLEGWYMKNYVATDDRYRTQTKGNNVSDEVIIERLKNIPSVIEMPFNQVVRQYIDRYAKSGSTVTACLGLSNYYLPIIEQALEAEGLPNELKYVPMIESSFNPNAVSRAGATGMWQFMLSAAKGYDMEVSSLVDERRDPYESSKKGAKLLKDLYNTYGRWDLAIAAYNCGPGNVNKALRRAGGDPKQHDFWSIYNYLPSETRGYFPKFVAANYIMNYYPDHNISPVVPTKPLITDTVSVKSRVHFNQISKVLDIPIDELRLLNPQYRNDVIPGTPQHPYMLILPSRQIAAYIMSEDEIKGYNASQYARRVVAEPGTLRKDDDIDIEITNDDLLVAEMPETPQVEETQSDEDYRMVREASRKKQEDDRRRAREAEEAQRVGSTTTAQTTASNVFVNAAGQTIHKVVEGEDLTSIARQHRVSVDQLKLWNNLSRPSLRVGQQLVIKGGSATVANNTQSRQTENYDDMPAQPAAPAKPASQATRRPSRAQATQATNAQQANTNTQTANKPQTAKQAAQQNNKQQAAQQLNNKQQNNKQAAQQQNNKQQNNKQAAQQQNNKQQNNKQVPQQQQNNKQQNNKQQNNKQAQQQQNNKQQNNKQQNNKQAQQHQNKKAQAAPAKPATHEVQGGESLDRIAKKHGTTVDELRKANPHVKGDMIHPGDKMNIPKKGNATDAKKAADNKNTQTNKKGAADNKQKAADNTKKGTKPENKSNKKKK